jgi:hypothetical protein
MAVSGVMITPTLVLNKKAKVNTPTF